MVISPPPRSSIRAFLLLEVTMAIAILVIAIFPLAYSFSSTARLFRATYQHAVAMELVDGEMEILAAGEWRALPEGVQEYPVSAAAAQNLPPGRFRFTRSGNHLRLEWAATQKSGVRPVVREVTVK